MNRVMPHSNEAEQAILGAMLVYPSVIRVVFDQGLVKEDFFLDIHQRIFAAMEYLSQNGKPIDVTSLITRLQDSEELHLVGGADYILKLSDTAVSGANANHYIELIKNRAHLRKLIETAQQIAEDGFDTGNELDDVMDQAERSILSVTRSRKATAFKSSKEIVNTVIQELIRLRSTSDHVTGIKTGYYDLDRMTNGFQRGDLIILAARPSMGKTAFALNLALNASQYNTGAIAIFSLEMPAEALMKRIMSAKSHVESNKLRSGILSDDEFNKLNESANELSGNKLFIDDSSNVKIAEIYSKCRKLKSEYGLDMVVIDYLQLISGSSRGNKDNRQQEIAEISRSLKGLAREMDCPVIALSQLSRAVESRPDKHPMLSDLRESGSIEQDADIVMFLYRDEYYNKDKTQESDRLPERTDVDIAKHRNGATGRIELAFSRHISAFFNYTETM
ncbi:MAG: replicative DNA helicase [Erysipelotrichaceae bacterium]|nr:replicative DNA helicase [Erysipelotrichaceae bacterium]MCI9524723.1 replicative DNA helicase [Erysipelotrichaceae bacterium]